jgi:hypothetical protein
MTIVPSPLRQEYWENFVLHEEDIEFLYNYLLEEETPLTPRELVSALIEERIRNAIQELEKQRIGNGEIYLPKGHYIAGQKLVFPAMNWRQGEVIDVRPAKNPDEPPFEVIRCRLDDGEERQFAAGLEDHRLNRPHERVRQDEFLGVHNVLAQYGGQLEEKLRAYSATDRPGGLVRIAGRLFPRSLLVDVNTGHLNLAEAMLDMAGGGPLPTATLLEQVGLASSANARLLEFSLDLALQEDGRFDEVGAAGEVLWYLNRLEPEGVRETPLYLRYHEVEHDRTLLTKPMLDLEQELDDELSPADGKSGQADEATIRLIYPHWRAGTLPLSPRIRNLFPTAYEAPRIRFTFVDRDTKEPFTAWVVRAKKYVFGLRSWYQKHGLIPGSLLHIQRGKKTGEIIIGSATRRASRDWMRTVLVGSDGGIVFAMLKQTVSAAYDERMAIAVPDVEALDGVWLRMQKERPPFERVTVNMVRELAKLNPQSHVHASELYAAVNLVRRCPPGVLLTFLASRSWFAHVGDLHFRFDDLGQV